MNKVKFIFAMMKRGFSWQDATVASMFEICSLDYGWLSRRSKKTLFAMIKGVRDCYGPGAHKLCAQLNRRPDVRRTIWEVWWSHCSDFEGPVYSPTREASRNNVVACGSLDSESGALP